MKFKLLLDSPKIEGCYKREDGGVYITWANEETIRAFGATRVECRVNDSPWQEVARVASDASSEAVVESVGGNNFEPGWTLHFRLVHTDPSFPILEDSEPSNEAVVSY
jgi:hypothetical protein